MLDNMCKKITCEIMKRLHEIERDFESEVLFGAVGGSISLGLNNQSSDIDIYLVFGQTEHKAMRPVSIGMCEGNHRVKKADFMALDANKLKEEIERYNQTKILYPTKLHRTGEDNEFQKKDIEREDFGRSVLCRIFLADEVVNREKLNEFVGKIQGGLQTVLLIDNQFTRLYGNVAEKIRDKESVPIRKYLYSLWSVWVCLLLMRGVPKPYSNFAYLQKQVAEFDDDFLGKFEHANRENIYEILKRNEAAAEDKAIAMMPSQDWLNEYLEKCVSKIQEYLERQNK